MLNQDQIAALQEISNVGMGQAGASIATVLEEFIHLSVPNIRILTPEKMPETLERTVGSGRLSVVRQAFHGRMRGEAIVIYDEHRCDDLVDLMGYEHDLDHASELEVLLDVSNILVGACLGGIAHQLHANIGFSAPSLMADRVPARQLLSIEDISWQNVLLIEVNFKLEKRSFACHLIMLMPEDDIKTIAEMLNQFLEGL